MTSTPNHQPMDNLLDSMMLNATAPSKTADSSGANQPAYIKAATWEGSKQGYYFGTGARGTGYYLDPVQQQPNQSSSKSSTKKKGVQFPEGDAVRQVRVFSTEEALEQAEKEAKGSFIVELSRKGIQTAASTLAKSIEKNALLRAQYAEEPQRYMDSELLVHEQLQAMTSIAANIQLYQYILPAASTTKHSPPDSLMTTLIQLLGHENPDIAATVVGLFLEWLDPELLVESPEHAETLQQVAAHVLRDAWSEIVANLQQRFEDSNSDDQALDPDSNEPLLAGMENTLSLMENLLELDVIVQGGLLQGDGENDDEDGAVTDQSAGAYMVQETKILSWLLARLDRNDKESETIDLQSKVLDVLSILSQRPDVYEVYSDWSSLPPSAGGADEEENASSSRKKPRLANIDGMELLLQIIGGYRKKQPETDAELGILENACTTVSSCISFSDKNLSAFVAGQGIELVVRCLKERVHSGGTALKLLDFSGGSSKTTKSSVEDEHFIRQKACEQLVQAGGLKFLFPMFLGSRIPKPAPVSVSSKKNASKKAKRAWLTMIESTTIQILYSLSQHLRPESPQETQGRFVTKFAEDDIKCDRLVELLLIYDEKARKAEYKFYLQSDLDEDDNEEEVEETVRLAALNAKLQGGGDLFYRLTAIAAYICFFSKTCHSRILQQLQLNQSGVSLLKTSLQDFANLLEEGPHRTQLLQHADSL